MTSSAVETSKRGRISPAPPPRASWWPRPGKPARSLALEETSPHHFEARIPASQSGLYSIASGDADLRLPVAGFYRESEELKPRAINVELLRQISAVSRGAVNPTVDQLLDDKGTLVLERRPLWPYWLILALAVNFVELAIRKGYFSRLRAYFPRQRPLTGSG